MISPQVRSDLKGAMEVGNYLVQAVLGTGSHNRVYLAQHKILKRQVALKEYALTDDEQKVMKVEIELMRKCRHIHVVELFEIIETDRAAYLAIELGDRGTLGEKVRREVISEHDCKVIFRQIVSGLAYLHSRNIAHRDLKPDNILLTRTGDCLITDFGMSRTINDPGRYTACGTPAFTAPEVVKRETYSLAADIWSLGIILYFMLTKDLPFVDESVMLTLQKIVENPVEFPPSVSPTAVELIEGMLQKDPEKRITLNEIIESDWLKEIPFNERNTDFESDLSLKNDVLYRLSLVGVDSDEIDRALYEQDPFSEKCAMYHIIYCETVKFGGGATLGAAGMIKTSQSVFVRRRKNQTVGSTGQGFLRQAMIQQPRLMKKGPVPGQIPGYGSVLHMRRRSQPFCPTGNNLMSEELKPVSCAKEEYYRQKRAPIPTPGAGVAASPSMPIHL